MFYATAVKFGSVTLMLFALLTNTQHALAADEERSVSDEQAARVLLLVSPDASESEIVKLLAERLSELNLETLDESTEILRVDLMTQVARSSARRTQAAIVVWFGAQTEPRELYIYDRQSDRTALRRLPRGQGDAAAREEWVIIATSTVSALLEGEHAPGTQQEPQPDVAENAAATSSAPSKATPAAKPPPETTSAASSPPQADPTQDANSEAVPTPDSHLELLLGYLGTSTLAQGGSWQNGASASLLVWLPRHLHASASYALLPAQRLVVGESRIELQRHPSSLAFGLHTRGPWRHWHWLIADLVLSVDRVTRTTPSPEAVLVATSPASRWLWDVGGRVGAAASVVSNVSLYGLIGGKLGASGFDYVALGDQTEDRTHVGRASAQIELGLCVSVF